jgi:hypothetical protein
MIKEKTLFILGAGSSKPYGFPTARELKTDICKNSADRFSEATSDMTGDWPLRMRHDVMQELERFVANFSNSPIDSIDLYLSLNPQYNKIGKEAIMLSILAYEKDAKFWENLPEDRRKYDWYNYLFNKMRSEIISDKDVDKFKENSAKLITFNYDRSLEYFLIHSLFNSFTKVDKKKLLDTFQSIPIIHVNGKIDNLREQYVGHLSEWEILGWGEDCPYPSLEGYLTNIEIIYKQKVDHDMIGRVEEMIKSSERIFFLGFSYAMENMEILKCPSILEASQATYLCRYDISDKEIHEIKANYFKGNFTRITLGNKDDDCLRFLKEHL